MALSFAAEDKIMVLLGRVLLAIALSFFYYLLVFQHILTPANGQIGSDGLMNVDLVIHEAGHFIFLPFQTFSHGTLTGWGMLLYIFGGSLVQWFVPLLFTGYFAWKRQWFAALVILSWFGESLLYSVPYIADAKTMAIPLLSDGLIHDWNYILTDLNLLPQTAVLALTIKILAITMLTLSVAGCWIYTVVSFLGRLKGIEPS